MRKLGRAEVTLDYHTEVRRLRAVSLLVHMKNDHRVKGLTHIQATSAPA